MLRLVGFLIIFSTFLSCNNPYFHNQEDDYSFYIGETSLESDVIFSPYEQSGSAGEIPSLYLSINTTEVYGCYNFNISNSVFNKSSTLIIRLEGIGDTCICLTSIGPARAEFTLPETTKKLVLINGDKIDEYEVEITDAKITIQELTSTFSTPTHKTTFRYPENSFAFICGTNVDNTNLCDDFKTILTTKTSVKEFTFPEDGHIPYPDSSGGNWVNNPANFYKYSTPAEYEKVGELLTEFTKKNLKENDGVSMNLYGWNNINYYSHMFK